MGGYRGDGKRYRVNITLELAQRLGVHSGRVEAELDEEQMRELDDSGALIDGVGSARLVGDYWPVFWRSDNTPATDPSGSNYDPILAFKPKGRRPA